MIGRLIVSDKTLLKICASLSSLGIFLIGLSMILTLIFDVSLWC